MRLALPLFVFAATWLIGGSWPWPDPAARADEATLPNGRRLNGNLQLTDGRLRFSAAKQSFRLDELHRVRFPAPTLPSVRPAVLHRIRLRDGQALTGELLGLDTRNLRLRPPWAGRLTIPRHAVAALTQLPGFVSVFADDFETDLKAWKLTGTPGITTRLQTSGERSLRLNTPGQVAECRLPFRVEAGRAGVNFYDPGDTAGARWLIEAQFEGVREPQVVRIPIGEDADSYGVEKAGARGPVRVPRKAGWHRCSIEFDPHSLIVGVDDLILWPPLPSEKDGDAPRRQGPGGALGAIRLACAALPKAAALRGEVLFDDFSLEQAVSGMPDPCTDLSQDELRLLTGDQVFGSIVGADRRSIELRGRFGSRTYPWSEIRGLHLRQEAAHPQTTDGEHVRVWLRTGATPELDHLDGVLKALNDKQLTLHHAALGTLEIDRARVQEMRGLLHGRRIEVENGVYHLGRQLVSNLVVPQPQGLTLRRTFRLDVVPAEAYLVVSVMQLKGPGDGPAIARALQRGGLRTEVVLNGRTVDYLNRLGERSSTEPRRLSLSLPRTALRMGENELVLRQTEDRETGRYEDCCLFGLIVEIPR